MTGHASSSPSLDGQSEWGMGEGRCFYGRPVGEHCIRKCVLLINSNNNGTVQLKYIS